MDNKIKEKKTIIDIIKELDRSVLANAYSEYSCDSPEKPYFERVKKYVTVAYENKEFELSSPLALVGKCRLTTTEIYSGLLHAIAEYFCEEF